MSYLVFKFAIVGYLFVGSCSGMRFAKWVRDR